MPKIDKPKRQQGIVNRKEKEGTIYTFTGDEKIKELPKKIRLRIAQVRTLYFVKKWTCAEIAEALHKSRRAIDKDIQFIRETGRVTTEEDLALKSDIQNFLWECNANYEERQKKLWLHHQDAVTPTDKTRILKEIRENEGQHISLLQDIGLVPHKKTEATDNKVVYISRLDKVAETKNVSVIPVKQEIKKEEVVKCVN